MPFARCIAAGVAPLGQRVRGVFRLPPLSLWTPLSPQRERGCSPLSDPKEVGSNRKYGRFTPFGVKIFSPYFRLPPIGKAPQSLRDSSPQGSGFRKSTYSRCAWTAGQQQQMQLPGTAPPVKKQLWKIRRFSRVANLKILFPLRLPECNGADRRLRRKQGGEVGAAASRMQGPPKGRRRRWEPQLVLPRATRRAF